MTSVLIKTPNSTGVVRENLVLQFDPSDPNCYTSPNTLLCSSGNSFQFTPSSMTAATTTFCNVTVPGTYTASASSQLSATYAAWNAFDYVNGLNAYYQSAAGKYNVGAYAGTEVTTDINGRTYSGEWIQLQTPFSTVLTSYQITPRSGLEAGRPTTFYIFGSTSGAASSWNILDSESSITYNSFTEPKTFYINASIVGSYNYYRLVANRVASDQYLIIQELRFYGKNVYSGTLMGNASLVNNSYYNINGASQYINTNLNPYNSNVQAYSFDTWFYDSSSGTTNTSNAILIGNFSGTNPFATLNVTNTGGLFMQEVDSTNTSMWFATSNFTVCDGKWHHIAVTANTSQRSLYVDGAYIGAHARPSGEIKPTNTPMMIGGNGGYNSYQTCRIGPTRFYWNKTLTQREIFQNMTYDIRRLNYFPVGTTGIVRNNSLIAYYDLTNSNCYPGSGTTVYDLSDINNTGTLNAAAVVNNGIISVDTTSFALLLTASKTHTVGGHIPISLEIWYRALYTSSTLTYPNFGYTIGGNGVTGIVLNASSTNIFTQMTYPSCNNYGRYPNAGTALNNSGQWQHVASTFTGSNMDIWLNGNLITTSSALMYSSVPPNLNMNLTSSSQIWTYDTTNNWISSTSNTTVGGANYYDSSIICTLSTTMTNMFTLDYEMSNAYSSVYLSHIVFGPTAGAYATDGFRVALGEYNQIAHLRSGAWNGTILQSYTYNSSYFLAASSQWYNVRVIRAPAYFRVKVKPINSSTWTTYMDYTADMTKVSSNVSRITFFDQGEWGTNFKRNIRLYDQALSDDNTFFPQSAQAVRFATCTPNIQVGPMRAYVGYQLSANEIAQNYLADLPKMQSLNAMAGRIATVSFTPQKPLSYFANSANLPTFDTIQNEIRFGANTWLRAPAKTYSISTSGITVLAKVRLNTLSSTASLLRLQTAVSTATSCNVLQIVNNSTTISYGTNAVGTPIFINTSYTLSNERPYIIGYRYDPSGSGTVTLFVDGSNISSTSSMSTAIPSSTGTITSIANSFDGTANEGDFTLYDFAIFSSNLNDFELSKYIQLMGENGKDQSVPEFSYNMNDTLSYPGTGSIVYDLSGNENTAIIRNGGAYVNQGYFYLNSSNTYVDTPIVANLGSTNGGVTGREFSCEAWFRGNISNVGIIHHGALSNQCTPLYIDTDGKLKSKIVNGVSSDIVASTTTVSDNKWHYCASVYTDTAIQIWVDGVLENTTTRTIKTDMMNYIRIGERYGTPTTARFHIGPTRMWLDKALTVKEIRTNFLAEKDKFTGLEYDLTMSEEYVVNNEFNPYSPPLDYRTANVIFAWDMVVPTFPQATDRVMIGETGAQSTGMYIGISDGLTANPKIRIRAGDATSAFPTTPSTNMIYLETTNFPKDNNFHRFLMEIRRTTIGRIRLFIDNSLVATGYTSDLSALTGAWTGTAAGSFGSFISGGGLPTGESNTSYYNLSSSFKDSIRFYANQVIAETSLTLPVQTGLRLWLDAADQNSFTLVTSNVSQWNDKSGNNNHFTQSTAASRPTRTATRNSNPVVTFNGSQIMTPTSTITHFATTGGTFVVVAKPIGTGYRNIYDSTSGNPMLWYRPDTKLEVDTGVIIPTGSVSNVWFYSLHTVGTTREFYLQGALCGTPNASGTGNMTIWNRSGSQLFMGDFAELILYNRILSTTERNEVFTYIQKKWGFA